jgi:D-alanyl-D-alanine carboxypeptidase
MRDSSRLFDRQTRALFFQQQKNNRGEPIEMTPGWHVGSIDGAQHFCKKGGGDGFLCEMRIYAASGIASVVIANKPSFGAHGFLDTVDKEFR